MVRRRGRRGRERRRRSGGGRGVGGGGRRAREGGEKVDFDVNRALMKKKIKKIKIKKKN